MKPHEELLLLALNGRIREVEQLIRVQPSILTVTGNSGFTLIQSLVLNRRATPFLIQSALNLGTEAQLSLRYMACVTLNQVDIYEMLTKSNALVSPFEAIVIAMFNGLSSKTKLKETLSKEKCIVHQKDFRGFTLLHYTLRCEYFDLARSIIDEGGNVNAISNDQQSPLGCIGDFRSPAAIQTITYLERHGALRTPFETIVLHLRKAEYETAITKLKAQPELVRVQNGGYFGTILHAAAAIENGTRLLKLVLNSGVSPNLLNVHGETPLHRAAKRLSTQAGGLEVMRTLVESGANLEAVDSHGDTPLLSAARTQWYEGILELIRLGASTTAVSRKGKDVIETIRGMKMIGGRECIKQIETILMKTGHRSKRS